MARVLEKREINWDELHGYVFREREVFEIKGIAIPALESFRREYVWFVSDGDLVRSPLSLRVNGVAVSKEKQAEYEKKWTKDKKERHSIERDSFFKFKFEPGNYLYAGRKKFEGREVVVVEYYPKRKPSGNEAEKSWEDKEGEKYEDMFYKTSQVTIFVVPEERLSIAKIQPWRFCRRGTHPPKPSTTACITP